MSLLRSGPSGRLFDLTSPLVTYGTQLAWFVDAQNGDDDSIGDTAAHPLKTLGELSRRLSNNILLVPLTSAAGAAEVREITVSLTGTFGQNDQLFLVDTFLENVTSLNISGVVANVTTCTISSVTALTVGSTAGWTLVTTGIDWTATTAQRLMLPGGQVAWVVSVVDANTITVSSFNATPVALQTLTVQSCTTLNQLYVSAYGSPRSNAQSVTPQVNKLQFNDLFVGTPLGTLTGGVLEVAPLYVYGRTQIAFNRCRIKTGMLGCDNATFNSCLIIPFSNLTSTRLEAFECQFANFQHCGFSGVGSTSTSFFFNRCFFQFGQCYSERVFFSVNQGSHLLCSNPLIIRNVQVNAAIFLSSSANAFCSAPAAIVSGTGNADVGINANAGCQFIYFNAAGKPTVTGGAGDTRIGGTVTAYAAIPAAGVNTANLAMIVNQS